MRGTAAKRMFTADILVPCGSRKNPLRFTEIVVRMSVFVLPDWNEVQP
jgi:hypothetical protein